MASLDRATETVDGSHENINQEEKSDRHQRCNPDCLLTHGWEDTIQFEQIGIKHEETEEVHHRSNQRREVITEHRQDSYQLERIYHHRVPREEG